MARQPRQSVPARPRKTVKVTGVLDAGLYTRMAAGAATMQVSHSTLVNLALEAYLKDLGIVVIQRRGNGQADSPAPVEVIDAEAA